MRTTRFAWPRAVCARSRALAAAPWPRAPAPPMAVGRLGSVDISTATTAACCRSTRAGRPPLGRRHAGPRIRDALSATHTGERMLAVTSVDGVNVVTGDTASPDQSGYVLDRATAASRSPAGARAWRAPPRSTSPICRDTYAARTGRPENVGVIGVAVFREKRRPVVWQDRGPKIAREAQRDAPAASGRDRAGRRAPRRRAPSGDAAAPRRMPADAAAEAAPRASGAPPLAKLGTGHGRSEDSHAQRVRFERASSPPNETSRSTTTGARTSSRWASCRRRATRDAAESVPGAARSCRIRRTLTAAAPLRSCGAALRVRTSARAGSPQVAPRRTPRILGGDGHARARRRRRDDPATKT